eukprot:7756088-Alexandrium_andersonii.AAC.1
MVSRRRSHSIFFPNCARPLSYPCLPVRFVSVQAYSILRPELITLSRQSRTIIGYASLSA